jgi:hypothetical protein
MAGLLKKIGKALGKVAKVVLPVVGVITGIGAIGGIVKGVGAIAGIGGVLKGGKKVIDKVGVSAVNLVTGTTQEERVQVRDQKAITKSLTDKIEQVQRLIRAGASLTSARATVGLSESELNTSANILLPGSITVDESNTGGVVEKATGTKLTTAGQGCLVTTLVILSSLVALGFILINLLP